jgi:hypothetical protein
MRVSRRNLLLTTAAAAAAPAQTPSKPTPTPAPIGRRFTGEALREIAFPLGGIGTGTVSLTGFGALRDWEIFNRPNKGSFLPFTFAALRLAGGGMAQPRIRVVERRPMPPFTGRDGPTRLTALGLPRFREATFTGAYPFANIRFSDGSSARARARFGQYLSGRMGVTGLPRQRTSVYSVTSLAG